jgi:RNA polymerase sigma factor for flagellar operon FliA
MTLELNQQQLVEKHLEYVVRIAKQVKRSVASNIETDDLISYGMTGLIEAAKRYDPKMGANFSTFSYYRIRGAIYDGLRTMGTLSRTEYRRQRFEEKAQSYMESSTGRMYIGEKPANNAEQELLIMAKKVQNLVTIYITSFDEKELNSVTDDKAEDALDRLARLELYEKMRSAIGNLAKSDQEIINSYYFEDKSLEEVGKALGLSKSWTSRKHAKAMEKLSSLFFALIKDPGSGNLSKRGNSYGHK